MIVACDLNRVIGIENRLPWRLSADLKRFKRLTTGHPVIMGRKTFESIGRPLPERHNIVVSRQKTLSHPQSSKIELVHSLDEALASVGSKDAFIIGGGELYRVALPRVDKIYLTEVQTRIINGDAFFPALEESQWSLASTESYQADDQNEFDYKYLTFLRNY